MFATNLGEQYALRGEIFYLLEIVELQEV
jgi:hypothetical protein